MIFEKTVQTLSNYMEKVCLFYNYNLLSTNFNYGSYHRNTKK